MLAMLLPMAVWGAGALWFQTSGLPRLLLLSGWCLLTLATVVLMLWPTMRRARASAVTAGGPVVGAARVSPAGGPRSGVGRYRRLLLGVFALCSLALLGWWQSVQPSHQRAWAEDVARLLQADIDGDRVRIQQVRNFFWRSETDYSVRWETRHYDLRRLASADLILSYWMGPHIAHTLVSFGFDDGQQLVFSLEIRKERHEAFDALAGFFRRYEQVIIAADEHDIIRTRTSARGEDVYLYRLNFDRAQLRTLFLGYLAAAEKLRTAPDFYNTLTSNCTTIVFDMARLLAPGLPIDWRLLASGHFAEYAFDQGGLMPGTDYPTLQAQGHINAAALSADRKAAGRQGAAESAAFSRAIRQKVPGWQP